MINLLPPELKQDYRYARYNRRLVQWSCAFLLAIIGVAAITAVGLFVMKHSIDTHRSDIAHAQTELASQNMAATQKRVTEISNNLKLMVNVLSKEVLFSKLLTQLGSVTPPNVVLTNLSISQTESAVDITARTGNYAAAAQLQANLADPRNQIFTQADVVNINCPTSTQTTSSAYPCTATIRALFTSNNPFLFINGVTNAQKVGS